MGVLSIEGSEVIDRIPLTKGDGVFHRQSVVSGQREERYSISALRAVYRSQGGAGYGVTLDDGGDVGHAIQGFSTAEARDSFISALKSLNPGLAEPAGAFHSSAPTALTPSSSAVWQPMATGDSEAEKYYRRKNRAARKRKIGRAAATTACCGIPCLLGAMLLLAGGMALGFLLFWI